MYLNTDRFLKKLDQIDFNIGTYLVIELVYLLYAKVSASVFPIYCKIIYIP